jgi:hypothetical protein
MSAFIRICNFNREKDKAMNNSIVINLIRVSVVIIAGLLLVSCMKSGELITKPDEHTRVYEVKEKILLRAIAQVFKDKAMGVATIKEDKNEVVTEYLIQDDWRSKSIARVKKISWKETEVTLSVITEKKAGDKWELRRLLEKDQYDSILDAIELQSYREMNKID